MLLVAVQLGTTIELSYTKHEAASLYFMENKYYLLVHPRLTFSGSSIQDMCDAVLHPSLSTYSQGFSMAMFSEAEKGLSGYHNQEELASCFLPSSSWASTSFHVVNLSGMFCVEFLSSQIILGGHCSMVCQVSSKHTSSSRIPDGMPAFLAQRHSSLLLGYEHVASGP